MRAVVQRISRATVTVAGEAVGRIAHGLLVYVGIGDDDGAEDVEHVANKIRYLRIFEDDDGKMNRDVVEAGGAVLIVSNFTLLGDTRKGRRPAFAAAAEPATANKLYEQLCARLRALGLDVQTGRFRERMAVESINDGPINILVDSKRLF